MCVIGLLLGLLITMEVVSPAERPCDSAAIGVALYNVTTGLAVLEQRFATLNADLSVELNSVTTRLATVEQELAALNRARRKVAFSAQFSHDDGHNGIHLGHRSTLKFDNVLLNIGNSYNHLTGIFTAPAAGLYVFSVASMTTNGRGPASLALVAQGVDKAQTWGDGQSDTHDQSTKTVPVQLDEGDQVWVAQRAGDAVRGSWWTTFSGFLVQAD